MQTSHPTLFSSNSLILLGSILLAAMLLTLLIAGGELAGGSQLQTQAQGFDALSQLMFGQGKLAQVAGGVAQTSASAISTGSVQ